MAKGENIFRRRDGRWEARYIKGRELSGKIKYGYCYGKTYREAKEKAAKRKAALANGAPLPTARTQKPFSSYCLEWLHTKKCTVKESTYIKYSTAVNKHIIPKLGVCRPLGFTTELMDDFIKELQFEDELAPKTVHDILVVLHGILKFASSKFAAHFPRWRSTIRRSARRRCAFCPEKSRRASLPIYMRIWIRADLVSCWRYVQAYELVNSVHCSGKVFLQTIKLSELQRPCKGCMISAYRKVLEQGL